jgi:hypothetical protein
MMFVPAPMIDSNLKSGKAPKNRITEGKRVEGWKGWREWRKEREKRKEEWERRTEEGKGKKDGG